LVAKLQLVAKLHRKAAPQGVALREVPASAMIGTAAGISAVSGFDNWIPRFSKIAIGKSLKNPFRSIATNRSNVK
jgi:hypothetical protein